jgi:uncharacterized damage-inducible protein DinB
VKITKRTKNQKNEEKKAKLLSGLVDTRGKILASASSLSPEDQNRLFLGSWSAKDLLAHLAGWDETNLKAAKEILENALPSFYAEHDRGWATYNAKLVAEFSMENYEDQLVLARDTHARLLEFLKELSADELWKDRGIRARGWKVTIGRLLEAEMSDEEQHLEQLNRFMESRATS